jgi:hypothetical protein
MASLFDFSPKITGLLGEYTDQLDLSAGLPGTDRVSAAVAENGAKRKPAFFSKGETGRNIAGLLGDYLMQFGGMQPAYAPEMQRRRQLHEAQRLYDKKRADEWDDWQRKLEYMRAREHLEPNHQG